MKMHEEKDIVRQAERYEKSKNQVQFFTIDNKSHDENCD